MANGDTGQSKAPYIIICAGQTAVRGTSRAADKICYASECAAEFVKHLELTQPEFLQEADYETISELQHAMMNVVETATKKEAEQMSADMFTLLRRIEQRQIAQPGTH